MNKGPIPPIPHYHLTGDVEESFYKLGLKDRLLYEKSFEELHSLLKVGITPIDHLLRMGKEFLAQRMAKRNLLFPKEFLAYAEGLGPKEKGPLMAFLIPEIITSIHQLMPKLPILPFACSSLFHQNKASKEVMHGRILDFPLHKTYQECERTLLHSFEGLPQIWSLGMVGLPFPSLSAMNSEGITCALHMKYGGAFNLEGHFIFEIIYKILQECSTVKDVLCVLKRYPAISSWGLYITTKEGKGLCVDLFGKHLYSEEVDLCDIPLFYGHNLPVKKGVSYARHTDGFKTFCEMRQESFLEKKETLEQLDALDPLSLLSLLGRPVPIKKENTHLWHCDTLTISSIHTLVMNAVKGEVHLIPGPIPKIIDAHVLKIDRIWELDNPRYHEVPSMAPAVSPAFRQGLTLWARANGELKDKKKEKALATLEEASLHLKDYADQRIVNFYILVLQFAHATKRAQETHLLQEFKNIYPLLPPYLADHAKLFIFRLERLLYEKSDILLKDIETPSLKKLYQLEKQIPLFLYKKMKGLVSPQMSTFDIFYPYYLT